MRSTDLPRSAALLATAFACAPAMAQESGVSSELSREPGAPTRLESNRANDAKSAAYEQVGARVGAFRVLPRIELGVMHDDNVFATENNERSDTIFRVAPRLLLRADTSRYRWDIRAGLEHLEYDKSDAESRTNYGAGTNIRTEVVRDTELTGRLGYDVTHEDREDPNSERSNAKPVKFKAFEGGLGFERAATRAIFGLNAYYRNLNFNDVRRLDGTINNNDDRDRDLAAIGAKIGYEFSPGYNFLVRATYDNVNYDQSVDDQGFDRDSKGYRVTGGIGFELTRVLTGEVFAGYLSRNYDDARLETINDATFGAGLTWSPTGLTTVRINADRAVEETVFGGYSGYVNTTTEVRIEHELTRQIILDGSVRYGKNDYKLSTGSMAPRRDDDVYGARLGVRYTLNRLLYAGGGYEWSKRSSNLPNTDFNRNKFQFTVGAQF